MSDTKPKVCRLAKLDGMDDVVVGRDFADLFKEGHVYDVRESFGQIILTDLGKHGKMQDYRYKKRDTIIMDGQYLLTETELIAKNLK